MTDVNGKNKENPEEKFFEGTSRVTPIIGVVAFVTGIMSHMIPSLNSAREGKLAGTNFTDMLQPIMLSFGAAIFTLTASMLLLMPILAIILKDTKGRDLIIVRILIGVSLLAGGLVMLIPGSNPLIE